MRDIHWFSAQIDKQDLSTINDQRGSSCKTFYLNRKVSDLAKTDQTALIPSPVRVYSSYNLLALIGSWIGITSYDKSKNVYFVSKEKSLYDDIVKGTLGTENSPSAKSAVAYHTLEGAIKRGDWGKVESQINALKELVDSCEDDEKSIPQEKLQRAFRLLTDPEESFKNVSKEQLSLIESLKDYCTDTKDLAKGLKSALLEKKCPIPELLSSLKTFGLENVTEDVLKDLQKGPATTLPMETLKTALLLLKEMKQAGISPQIDTVLQLVDNARYTPTMAHELSVASGLISDVHDLTSFEKPYTSPIAYFAFEPTLDNLKIGESHEFHASDELFTNITQDIKANSPVMHDLLIFDDKSIKFDPDIDHRCTQAMEKYLGEENSSSKIETLLKIMHSRNRDVNFVVSMMLVSTKISIGQIWDAIKNSGTTNDLNNETFQYLIDSADIAKNPELLLEIYKADTKSRIDLTQKELDLTNWSIAAAKMTLEKALNDSSQDKTIGLKITARTESDLKALSELLTERFARIEYSFDPAMRTIEFTKFRTVDETRNLCMKELEDKPLDALNKMKYAKIPPNSEFCTLFLNSHLHSDAIGMLLTELKSLPESTAPLLAAYTGIMKEHISGNDTKSAEEMFNIMSGLSEPLPRKETLILMQAANTQASKKGAPQKELHNFEDMLAETIPLSFNTGTIDARDWTMRSAKKALHNLCLQLPMNKDITLECTVNKAELVRYLQDTFREMFVDQKGEQIIVRKRDLFIDSMKLNKRLDEIASKDTISFTDANKCLREFKDKQLEMSYASLGAFPKLLAKCLSSDSAVKSLIEQAALFRYPPSLYDCQETLTHYINSDPQKASTFITLLLNKIYVPNRSGSPFDEKILNQFAEKAIEVKSFKSLETVLQQTTLNNNPYKEKLFNSAIEICLKNNSPDQALKFLKQFHDTNPTEPLSDSLYAQILLSSSAESKQVLEPILKDKDLLIKVCSSAVASFIEKKSFAKAQEVIDLCIEKCPDSPALSHLLQTALEGALLAKQLDLLPPLYARLKKTKFEETVLSNLIENAYQFDAEVMSQLIGFSNLPSNIYVPAIQTYLNKDPNSYSSIDAFITSLPEGYSKNIRSACEQVLQGHIDTLTAKPHLRNLNGPKLHDLALQIFNSWNLSLTKNNYQQILEALLSTNLPQKGHTLLSMMLEAEFLPNNQQYCELIAQLAISGNIEDANAMLKEAGSLYPNSTSRNADILKAAVSNASIPKKFEGKDPRIQNLNTFISTLNNGPSLALELLNQATDSKSAKTVLMLAKALISSNRLNKNEMSGVYKLYAESTKQTDFEDLVDLLKFLKDNNELGRDLCISLIEQYKTNGVAAHRLLQAIKASYPAIKLSTPEWLLNSFIDSIQIDDAKALSNLNTILNAHPKDDRPKIVTELLKLSVEENIDKPNLPAQLKLLLKSLASLKSLDPSLQSKAIKRIFDIESQIDPETAASSAFQAINNYKLTIDDAFCKKLLELLPAQEADALFDLEMFSLEPQDNILDVRKLPSLVACKALEDPLFLGDRQELLQYKIKTDDPTAVLAHIKEHFPHIQFTATKEGISITSVATNPEEILSLYKKRLQECKNDPEKIVAALKIMNENMVEFNAEIIKEAIHQTVGTKTKPEDIEKAVETSLKALDPETLNNIGPKLFETYLSQNNLSHANGVLHTLKSNEALCQELLKATFGNESTSFETILETIKTVANAKIPLSKELLAAVFTKFPTEYPRLLSSMAEDPSLPSLLQELLNSYSQSTSLDNFQKLLTAIAQSPKASAVLPQALTLIEARIDTLSLDQATYSELIEQAMKSDKPEIADKIYAASKIDLQVTEKPTSVNVHKLPPHTASFALNSTILTTLKPNSGLTVFLNKEEAAIIEPFLKKSMPFLSISKLSTPEKKDMSLILKVKNPNDPSIKSLLLNASCTAIEQNNPQKAVQYISQLKHYNLLPDETISNTLLNLPEDSMKLLLKEMPKDLIETLFTPIIDSQLQDATLPKAATQLLLVKSAHPQFNPRFEHNIFESLLAKNLNEARSFFFALYRTGTAPDPKDTNTLIQAFIEKAPFKEALGLYESILTFDEQFKLSADTRMSFITAANAAKDFTFAKTLANP